MPRRTLKVMAYVTNAGRLLLLHHPTAPESGVQVPGGTVEPGEDPARAAVREAHEETGLEGLRLVGLLGETEHPVPERGEAHRRLFYHLACPGRPAETWRHVERHASDGSGPVVFAFTWARLPDGVPPLAPGHGALIERLPPADT